MILQSIYIKFIIILASRSERVPVGFYISIRHAARRMSVCMRLHSNTIHDDPIHPFIASVARIITQIPNMISETTVSMIKCPLDAAMSIERAASHLLPTLVH